jgi:hypothetical protein
LTVTLAFILLSGTDVLEQEEPADADT